MSAEAGADAEAEADAEADADARADENEDEGREEERGLLGYFIVAWCSVVSTPLFSAERKKAPLRGCCAGVDTTCARRGWDWVRWIADTEVSC